MRFQENKMLSYAAVAAKVPLAPEKLCSQADTQRLVVPRVIHEASEFLMNLHGVKPGTLALSELLRLRPELANLKWDIKSRKIDPYKKFEWLLCDWEFPILATHEVNDKRKQFEDSHEMYYSVAVFKRVFEILAASMKKRIGVASYFMSPCDTRNHIDIAMELVEFLMLPYETKMALYCTLDKCSVGRIWMQEREEACNAFFFGE